MITRDTFRARLCSESNFVPNVLNGSRRGKRAILAPEARCRARSSNKHVAKDELNYTAKADAQEVIVCGPKPSLKPLSS